MKFIVSQKNLNDAITTVQKAVSNKSNLPILKSIFIEAKGNEIRLVGNDLSIAIDITLEAEVITPSKAAVNSRLLGEIIRKLPDAFVTLSTDEHYQLTIKCMQSSFQLAGYAYDEYPDLPLVDHSVSYTMHKDLLVAIDLYRVAIKKVKVPSHADCRAVIPAKALNELLKILSTLEHKDDVTLYYADKYIKFEMGNIMMITRLLEGEFIKYNQIMPKDYKSLVTVKTEALYQAIDRASLMAKEGKNTSVKFKITDEALFISSNVEIGSASEVVSITLEGDDLEIGFNPKYWLDVLKVIDSEMVQIELTTNVSPCIVKPLDQNDYTYLVLPVRIVN